MGKTNKQAELPEARPSVRLRELDPPGGAGLGRVQDFEAGHAEAILALQTPAHPTWEVVDDTVPLSEGI
ncbi:hypothetical protein [Spirosoma spitsbergense]|uniref:hypothetical protein n=1 Tax=Spirosoma spitsbergense TaxID=431554 RepID=UPI000368A234|nr:hypothetical protein [Spirosoma spitsbergense]